MKNLFIVGAKLFGIYLVMVDASSLIQLVVGVILNSKEIIGNELWNLDITTVYLIGIPFLIHFTTGISLLFFTETIATLLRIPNAPLPPVDSCKPSLQIGLILLGIYGILLSVQPLSNLAMTYYGNYPYMNSTAVRFDWQGLYSQSIRIMLSGVLIFASEFISSLLIRKNVVQSSI